MTPPDETQNQFAIPPCDTVELGEGVSITTLTQDQSSHLVVHRGQSLLVDCHTYQLSRWLDRRGLPHPIVILYTHIQPEHCRQADQFASAEAVVPDKLASLANDPEAFHAFANTVWDDPAAWPETMGEEPFGVAGSLTMLPPETPVHFTRMCNPGDDFNAIGLTFRVVGLPGHGKHGVGYLLMQNSKPLAFFCGDLLTHPASLINVYDLELTYGGTALPDQPVLLNQAADLGAQVWFPASGPAMLNGPAQARHLAQKIDAYHEALQWSTGDFTPQEKPDYPALGRYVKLHEGIYQITNGGNCIVFIDDRGRGMIIDPGPCDYENPSRDDDFIADLELLENQAGLKTIDLAMITHIHGDHYDLAPLVQKKYPGCKIAAWDLVARVIEAPWDYPYPALLPWYNLGFDYVHVDEVLHTGTTYHWHDTAIDSIHLPGHCYCHAAYLLTFNGLLIALTGDTIQSNGGAQSLSFIIANHSAPGEKGGCLQAFREIAKHDIDLNIGGHGSNFAKPNPAYDESIKRMEHALPYLEAIVPDGDLERAFIRPWFPKMDAAANGA